jgi:hypothetical protein
MVVPSEEFWASRSAELGDLREVSTPRTVDPLERRFGDLISYRNSGKGGGDRQ